MGVAEVDVVGEIFLRIGGILDLLPSRTGRVLGDGDGRGKQTKQDGSWYGTTVYHLGSTPQGQSDVAG
jgi:hypothetical protein